MKEFLLDMLEWWPAFAVLIVGAIIFYVYKKRKDSLIRDGKLSEAREESLRKRYSFYNSNFLVRNTFRKIVSRFIALSCYDKDEVREQSVKLFERSILSSVAFPIISIALFRDVLLTLLVCLVAYIYFDMSVNRKMDALYVVLMRELSSSVQSIQEKYLETSNVAMAVLYCDKGEYLEQPLNEIYEILTNVRGEQILDNFIDKSPIRMLKTLAMTCHIVNEWGDTTNADGISAFVTELSSIRQEIDSDIRGLLKEQIAFKTLPFVTLIGIIAQPIIDLFLITKMPGTSVLLKGMYGYVEKIVLIVITFLAYWIIANINQHQAVNQSDRSRVIDLLLLRQSVQDFVKKIIPKKYKYRYKWNERFSKALSTKDLEYVYTEKCLYSVVAFIVTMVVLTVAVIVARSALYNNYGSLTLMPSTIEWTEVQFKQVKKMDAEYLAKRQVTEQDEATAFVRSHVEKITEMDAMEQADRLIEKYKKYHGIKWQWYFIVISYLAAVGAWFIPEWLLNFRADLVKFEEDEDVLQMQTMMMVLSNTQMDVFNALYWLNKQTIVHKPMFTYAYQEYTSDPEGSLERLKEKIDNKDLKRLVSKLISTVYSLSVSEAFCDMAADRNQSIQIKEMYEEESIARKVNKASSLSIGPFYVAIFGGFVIPILYLGIMQLMNALSTL